MKSYVAKSEVHSLWLMYLSLLDSVIHRQTWLANWQYIFSASQNGFTFKVSEYIEKYLEMSCFVCQKLKDITQIITHIYIFFKLLLKI